MKIEKLTENKIRIIIESIDLGIENIDLNSLIAKPIETQNFLNNILEKAKEEIGFNTDGCKLFIEAFSSSDDILVFTITKYSSESTNQNADSSRKRLSVKRKALNISNKNAIYKCPSFDYFCDFCNAISKKTSFDIKSFSKNISLYLYNNTYYLIVKNITSSSAYQKIFYSIASEFLTPVSFSDIFENKLIEHGKAIIKKNAINTGIKFFVTK